ncbi:TetR family transcriptional regulator C-terminal domain-containing protein [Deinococcus maricopensis]|uniref:Regulatory protein TetR n=1 Tax=Deinococcus maricopensis (strain DSM 21211 / LMG 22137 / NRRL B-23946 / LB-34) TaxID=709986 RepID=E8U818_DEIML|nr:TetR family transcriptional regulator [Deinococcus maricopensis]ADV67207.1 regulatory protein TetR [Deinococcus maricopensis DSM 21211]
MARTVDVVAERRRRAGLEKAAYLAIYQHGYARVTLADVARHAGVAKGTLAYHFGSKEGLIEAVMRRFVRTVAVSTRRAVRLAGTPDAKLVAFVEHQFYGLESTRRFYTVYVDFLSASTKSDALMRVQRAFLAESRALDEELARLSGAAGVEARAQQLRALVDGLSLRFLADDAPDLDVYRAVCLAGLRALLGFTSARAG